ncbi:hypothetical protein BV25DRAFT_1912647 [Artomyces pyxidatus]|uniref:Uncharacterized protein n=1 Tax=Artomyces pyxidatus TaxID=48021 RepID=A0ACB8TDT2_9AGAM|nr:hypothetical protein BV25DRAFT_1912647 [Artomyces pyxidatus]
MLILPFLLLFFGVNLLSPTAPIVNQIFSILTLQTSSSFYLPLITSSSLTFDRSPRPYPHEVWTPTRVFSESAPASLVSMFPQPQDLNLRTFMARHLTAVCLAAIVVGVKVSKKASNKVTVADDVQGTSSHAVGAGNRNFITGLPSPASSPLVVLTPLPPINAELATPLTSNADLQPPVAFSRTRFSHAINPSLNNPAVPSVSQYLVDSSDESGGDGNIPNTVERSESSLDVVARPIANTPDVTQIGQKEDDGPPWQSVSGFDLQIRIYNNQICTRPIPGRRWRLITSTQDLIRDKYPDLVDNGFRGYKSCGPLMNLREETDEEVALMDQGFTVGDWSSFWLPSAVHPRRQVIKSRRRKHV